MKKRVPPLTGNWERFSNPLRRGTVALIEARLAEDKPEKSPGGKVLWGYEVVALDPQGRELARSYALLTGTSREPTTAEIAAAHRDRWYRPDGSFVRFGTREFDALSAAPVVQRRRTPVGLVRKASR